MGNYNPHAPYMIGEEWVPIREEDLVFSPSVNSVELGASYVQSTAQRPRDARFYIHEMPKDGQAFYQTVQMGLYPAGTEDLTGPIQEIIIPVQTVTVTGHTGGLNQTSSYAEAVYQPGDNKSIYFNKPAGTPTASAGKLSFYFKATDYPILSGKRILNCSLLYRGSVQDGSGVTGGPFDFVNPFPSLFSLTLISQLDNAGVGQQFSASQFSSETGALILNTKLGPSFNSLNDAVTYALDIGDINNCWDATAPAATNEKLPWTYNDLQRFDFGAVNRQHIELSVVLPETSRGTTSALMLLDYIALRVIYCDERRVAYGAQQCQYSYGMNRITLRDLARNVDPVIPAGEYTATLSAVSMGQVGLGAGLTGVFPKLNALRQAYEIPSHRGVKLNIPFPLEDRLGDTFTVEDIDILPQISIHTSGATLTEPHVYGRQAAAQVFGTITATQEVADAAAITATTFPQVRYYARRFGETTVPLLLDSPTITGAGRSVSLTPAEWDALPELIDGWKEITKRFTSPPTMGSGTNPQWRWSATGEASGNRWEVLGAIAPAISGIPSTFITQVPTAQRLATATYGAPAAGSTINMGWMPGFSPVVNTTTDDPSTDAVLIFSQDPATVTGLTITTLTQPLTGFTECTRGPCCIPTALSYNRITWGLPVNTGILVDSFSRVVANGMGTPDRGNAYATTGAASQYAVDGERGLITPAVAGTRAFATSDVGVNFDITADVSLTANMAAGSIPSFGVVGRYTDANNWYLVALGHVTASQLILTVSKMVAGVQTDIGPDMNIPGTVNAGSKMTVRFMGQGSVLKTKVWPTGTPEPGMWMYELTDSSLTTGSRAGMWATSFTALGNTMAFDNLTVGPPSYWFGGYELQRLDPVGSRWETIMLATSPTVTGFNDFEARVGVTSSYQIRQLNDLNFAGAWSVTGTGAIAEPGVTLPSCGTNKRGVLIFTSNELQDGSRNLAYAMTWEDRVSEDFSFPETDTLQVQRHHDRDFQIAFHGSERGGEQFSRRLLLANAAVPLPRLANMDSLRDLAWADLSYVCVRDDIGDRWLASVIVPGGTVRRKRRLYNADITVIEVTDTPTEVDP